MTGASLYFCLPDESARFSAGGDIDTSDLLTGIVGEFEKHVWFLRATLGD